MYGTWYRQFQAITSAGHEQSPSQPADFSRLCRMTLEDEQSRKVHESRLRALRHRFDFPSRMCRSQKKTVRTLFRNLSEQDWSHQGLIPAYACVSDSLWEGLEPLTGALSPNFTRVRSLTVPPEVNVLFTDWTAEYKADPYWSGVYAALRQDDPSVRPPAALEDFGLYRHRIRFKGKHAVPRGLLQQVILACHSYVHGGFDKTLLMVDRKFYFHGLSRADLEAQVKTVCDACAVCQQTKPRTGKQPGSVDHFPIPSDVFSSLSIDFVDLPEAESGGVKYDYCMVVVCRLSGYVLAIPTTKRGLDSRKAAELFLERVVFFMGLPARIFADNQSVITSAFTQHLCALSGIEQHQSVIFYPSSNGRAEAAVKAVVMALRKFLHQRPGKWIQALPLAVSGLNDLPGLIAPYSPHRFVFGRDPVGFGDVPPFVPGDGAEDALQFFERVASERKEVWDRLTAIHDRLSRDLTAKYRAQRFQEGDKVWVKVRPDDRRFDKLKRIWQGPYEVRRWVGGDRYEVITNEGRETSGFQVLKTDRLKPYIQDVEGRSVPCGYYSEKPIPPTDDTYIVQQVVDHHFVGRGRGRKLVLVIAWKDYPDRTDEEAAKFVGKGNERVEEYIRTHKLGKWFHA